MAELWTNNAKSTLASGISDVATALTVAAGEGARFPSPTAPDFFFATLDNGSAIEIIKCTARSGDVFSTIERGQQGTTPVAWGSAAPIEHRWTRVTAEGLFQSVQKVRAEPVAPPAGHAVFYTLDNNGNVVARMKAADGSVLDLTPDFVAKNTQGGAITVGQAAYISGGVGASGVPEVKLAKADADATVPAVGLVLEASIADNGFGRILTKGLLGGLNTASFSQGASLFVSAATAGALTATPPTHPNLRQRIAVVINSHASQGTVFIDPVGLRGDQEGTNKNTWVVGDGAAGTKVVRFKNVQQLDLQANPTASRTLTLPDATGTLALEGAAPAAHQASHVTGGDQIATFGSSARGLVPASGGGTTNFLRADGTFAAPPGGGASPGGASGDVQYNNGAGGFGGSADLNWNNSTKRLLLAGADTELELEGITNEPSPPGANRMLLYGRAVAGRMLPKIVGPAGVDTPLQPFFGFNAIRMAQPLTAATLTTIGQNMATAVGTATTPNPASTNLRTSLFRRQLVSAAAANSAVEDKGTILIAWRGNAAGLGGFMFTCRFALASAVANQRLWVGLNASTAALATTLDPVVQTNVVGIGNASADANLQILHNDNAGNCTKVNLGASFPSGSTVAVYELSLFCGPNASTIGWRVVRLDTGAVAEGTISTDLLQNTVFLTPHIYQNNGGTASAVTLDWQRLYIESDV